MTHEELKAVIRERFANDSDIWKQLGIPKAKYDRLAMKAKRGEQWAIQLIHRWAMEATPTAYSREDFNALMAVIDKYSPIIWACLQGRKPRKRTQSITDLTKLLLP